MPFTVRSFAERDYGAVASLIAEVDPAQPVTIEYLKRISVPNRRRRFVVESGGTVIGYASVEEVGKEAAAMPPVKSWMFIAVHCDWQRQGVGSALYDRLIADARKMPVDVLRARTRMDNADSLAFLRKRGFNAVQINWDLVLDLDTVDPSRYDADIGRARANDIEIMSLSEARRRDPKLMGALHELCLAVWRDVPPNPKIPPRAQALTPMPYEDFVAWLEGPDIDPEAFFVARQRGSYIGFTHGRTHPLSDGLFQQGWTGVRREARLQGVATALKAAIIEHARRAGYKAIVSRVGSYNVPSTALNEKMGFCRRTGWITLEKTM